MTELGTIIDFKERSLSWDGLSVRMSRNKTSSTEKRRKLLKVNEIVEYDNLPGPVQEAEECRNVILEAKYEAADLEDLSTHSELTPEFQEKVLQTLHEFEELFSGKLGKMNAEPYRLPLQKGAKRYHARAFPVPQIHLETRSWLIFTEMCGQEEPK